MTGSNNPLSEYCRHPRRDTRGSLPGTRSANPSRVDLLPTPAVRNDTSTPSTSGLFSYLGNEPSFRARDDGQGELHGTGGEAHPRGASGGRLESHRVTARDFRASSAPKTALPPDPTPHQGTSTSVRRSAELLGAPALGVAAGERAYDHAISRHPWFMFGSCLVGTLESTRTAKGV